jgi:gluconolactonase
MNTFLVRPLLLASLLAATLPLHAQRDVLVRSRSSAVPGPAGGTAAPAPARSVMASTPAKPAFPAFGQIERMAPEFDALIAPGTQMEKLADGFTWSEGPVWMRREGRVLFSDVPENRVYAWSERDGLSVFLEPSGYTGKWQNFREKGSNGLTTDKSGRLVLCQHGDRQVARYERGQFEPLARHYNGRAFNSPNDLCFAANGNLYFTDPPYGLDGVNDSPLKEIMFNGVYLRRPSGDVVLLTSKVAFPNGIALSADQKTLYVAQSDGRAPVVMAYPIVGDGTIGDGRVFFDTTPLMPGRKGVPDGLKVDQAGNVWTTGPGGVLVISPEGKLLGLLNTGEATANCGWGDADGGTLYITADAYLLRVRTLTQGAGWVR